MTTPKPEIKNKCAAGDRALEEVHSLSHFINSGYVFGHGIGIRKLLDLHELGGGVTLGRVDS